MSQASILRERFLAAFEGRLDPDNLPVEREKHMREYIKAHEGNRTIGQLAQELSISGAAVRELYDSSFVQNHRGGVTVESLPREVDKSLSVVKDLGKAKQMLADGWCHEDTATACGYKSAQALKVALSWEKRADKRGDKETKKHKPCVQGPADQAIKADHGKPSLSLVPSQIILDVAGVREYGNRKYGDSESWKRVELRRYVDALYRHMLEFVRDPGSKDAESGIEHYKHMACNLAFLCEMLREEK